jgi:hypothetical protein
MAGKNGSDVLAKRARQVNLSKIPCTLSSREVVSWSRSSLRDGSLSWTFCVTRFTARWSMRRVSGSRKGPSGGIHPLFLAFVLRKGYSGVLQANE